MCLLDGSLQIKIIWCELYVYTETEEGTERDDYPKSQ